MSVGLLYDVDGNLPALEAVLADARAAGVQRWILGGDYSASAPGRSRSVEHRRGTYDVEAAAREVTRRFGGAECAVHPVRRLETASMSPS